MVTREKTMTENVVLSNKEHVYSIAHANNSLKNMRKVKKEHATFPKMKRNGNILPHSPTENHTNMRPPQNRQTRER